MSSSAAAAVADAADGAAAAAAAHVPGMDDRLAALKAERQALKRQPQQASREVKAQAGQGTTSSVCAIFVLGVSRLHRDYISPNLHLHFAHINICLAEVALNLHRITCLFNLSISFQSCGRRRNAAGC